MQNKSYEMPFYFGGATLIAAGVIPFVLLVKNIITNPAAVVRCNDVTDKYDAGDQCDFKEETA